jgi:hypothetical protein
MSTSISEGGVLDSLYGSSVNWQYDRGEVPANPTRFWGKEVVDFLYARLVAVALDTVAILTDQILKVSVREAATLRNRYSLPRCQ